MYPHILLWGGVPAKVIRFRFSSSIIEKLLQLDYGKLTDETIKANIDALYDEVTEDNIDQLLTGIKNTGALKPKSIKEKKKMAKTTMYVIGHSDFKVPQLKDYVPLEVGAALHSEHPGFVRDDTGDNISSKNLSFCELTGIYWIWKNDKESDIIGICHYRRYFSKYLYDCSPKYYLPTDKTEQLLEKYDIILPKRFSWFKYTVANAYYEAGDGKEKDLHILEDVLCEKYPEYSEAMHSVWNSHVASYCNMFICSREQFGKYCEWLFDILFEVEKHVDMNGYTVQEARAFGYMSELLTNVWVEHHRLRVKYIPVAANVQLPKMKMFIARLEKIPVLGLTSNILLCKDIGNIFGSKLKKVLKRYCG